MAQVHDEALAQARADVRDQETRARRLTLLAAERCMVRHDRTSLLIRASVARVEALRARERLRLLEDDVNQQEESER